MSKRSLFDLCHYCFFCVMIFPAVLSYFIIYFEWCCDSRNCLCYNFLFLSIAIVKSAIANFTMNFSRSKKKTRRNSTLFYTCRHFIEKLCILPLLRYCENMRTSSVVANLPAVDLNRGQLNLLDVTQDSGARKVTS